jgi:hypothetical protein
VDKRENFWYAISSYSFYILYSYKHGGGKVERIYKKYSLFSANTLMG